MFPDLHPKLVKTLDKLGFSKPTEIQKKAIPLLLAGNDLSASAETGSGKTAAYLLPILHKMLEDPSHKEGTRALVLVPTRELAKQVEKQVEQLTTITGIKAGVLTGGASMKYQVAMLRKDPEILISTPGRLVDHSKGGSTVLENLEFLVLDEADKMLDMGFSDDVFDIIERCNPDHQTMLFSATMNARGLYKMMEKVLTNPKILKLNSFEDQQKQISQQIITADDLKHKENLVNWLLKNETYRKAIVFCNTKTQVDRLGGLLKYHKHTCGTLHGDNTQEVRNQVMTQFRDSKFKVLVASDVAARGLDVKEVDLVINFDMAQNGDDYIHRVGRTGRAGESGVAISLISSREWNLMASVEKFLKTTFIRRTIKALIGSYTGPKNLKANGKAASKGKRSSGKKLTAREKKRLDKKKLNKKNQKSASEIKADPISTKPKKKFGGVGTDPLTPLRKK